MDYNENREGLAVINNQPISVGGNGQLSTNDIINNRPQELVPIGNQFVLCDNQVKVNSDVDKEKKSLTLENRDEKQRKKSMTSWQQLSPKKEKKSVLGDSSGSNSSSASSPTKSDDASWKGSRSGSGSGSEKGSKTMTWRDVSPTKPERTLASSTSSSSNCSPKRAVVTSSSDSSYSPKRCLATSSSDSNSSPRRVLVSSSSSSNYSPKHTAIVPYSRSCCHMRSPKIMRQIKPKHHCIRDSNSSPEHHPVGSFASPLSPSHGNCSEGNDSALCTCPVGAKQGLNLTEEPEFYYDEDFTVQFDSNIRDLSPGCANVDPTELLGLPHVSAGSYLSFREQKGDASLEHVPQEIFCPDESELSYSRNSAMDMSTSDREMMCSSDMLDFSDHPLFTPSPSREVQAPINGPNLMSDSLDKVKAVPPSSLPAGSKNNVSQGQGHGQGQEEMSSSHASSSDVNVCYNCSPRKDAYHLSFVGSLGSKGSCSDTENSMTSMESGQGQTRNQESMCSEEGEEFSDSFHFTYPGVHGGKCKGSKGHRFNKVLGSVPESSVETSDPKGSSPGSEDLQSTLKTKQDSVGAYSENTFPRMSSPNKRTLVLNTNLSSPKSIRSHKSRKVMSWRQVKSLRKLGKLESVLDPSRSASMPELGLQQNWQSLSSQDLQKIAESFHNKRHSAYLLDLYQRVKGDNSNPASPETMANIEQILFHPAISQGHPHGNSTGAPHSNPGSNNSDHTITNSHPHTSEASNTGQPLDQSTRRRIVEWLHRERFDVGHKTRGMQTDVGRLSKETVISPTTVSMWCGTKNFSSQFPPVMCDCAIQTSFEERLALTNAAQQTSQSTERAALLSTLPESFTDLKEILPWLSLQPPEGQESEDLKTKTIIPRSKSADSSRHGKSVAVGDSPTKSPFYSYKSLPDLSFLSGKSVIPTPELSLFDPLPVDLPIPVLLRADDYACSQDLLRERSQSQCNRQVLNSPGQGQGHIKRSRSAPAKGLHPGMAKPCTDSGSSSSGFSTSSTSSGIDPGYSEPRSSTCSPSNDIERLLFYPPHVEISAKSQTSSGKSSFKDPDSPGPKSPKSSSTSSTPTHQCKPTPERAVPKCANDVHPSAVVRVKATLSPRSQSTCSSGVGSGCSSASSGQLDPHLAALQEEQTPTSSPERSVSPYSCCHDNCTCYIGMDLASIQDWRREQLMLRRRFDFHIQASGSESGSGSSSSSGMLPHVDKKPLKSCLRKKQVIRSRSMSEPFSSSSVANQNELKAKQKYKKNRHSYACEEVYLMRNENGDYFLCEQKDNSMEEEVAVENVDKEEKQYEDGEEEMTEDSGDPPLFYLEDDSIGNTNTVRRRLKKERKEEEQEESSDKELSGKRKSVSFASEVSFHAISPAESPKRREEQQTDEEEDDEEEEGGVEVEGAGKKQEQNNTKESQSASPESSPNAAPTVQQQVSTASLESTESDAPPTEFMTSPPATQDPMFERLLQMGPETARRRVMLHEVAMAAECLVRHFAEASNPFDKLRLGNTSETPSVGDLVLETLCPVLYRVVCDGMKQYATGVQVFGRVQLTVWKVVEATGEQGPYTQAVYDLVQQLKGHPGLPTQNTKFEAFIFGLLNLRLLDFWMGYLRFSDNVCEKYYNPDGVIVLGKTLHQSEFDEMLASLQALAILPFQLSYDFVASKFAKTKTSPTRSQSEPTRVGSPIVDKQIDQSTPSKPPRKPPTSITSKAWDWLKRSPDSAESAPTEGSTTPKGTGSMISSLTGMIGKLAGWEGQGEESIKGPAPSTATEQLMDEENGNVGTVPKPSECAEASRREKVKQGQEKGTPSGPRDISPRSKAKMLLERNRARNLLRSPDSDSRSKIPTRSLGADDGTQSLPQQSAKEERLTVKKGPVEEEDVTPTNVEKSMMDSVSEIAHKVFGITSPRERQAGRKGTKGDVKEATEKLRINESRIPQLTYSSRGSNPPSRVTSPEVSQLTPPQSPDRESPPSQSSSELGSSLGSSGGERPKHLSLPKGKIPVRQTSLSNSSSLSKTSISNITSTTTSTNVDAPSNSPTPTNVTPPKPKSGLIKLFDKLLLPRESSAPKPAAAPQSQTTTATQEPKTSTKAQCLPHGQCTPPVTKSRWSWGGSHQATTAAVPATRNNLSQVTEVERPTKGARPKSACLPPSVAVTDQGVETPKKRSTSSDNLKKKANSRSEQKNVNASPALKTLTTNLPGLQGNAMETLPASSQSEEETMQSGFETQGEKSTGLNHNSGEALLHSEGRREKATQQVIGPLDATNQSKSCKSSLEKSSSSDSLKRKRKNDKTAQKNLTNDSASSLEKSNSSDSLKKSGRNDSTNQSSQNKREVKRSVRNPVGRNSWHSVERGPTLILPTNCKFLDNIENSRKDTPESPKRLNGSPKRNKSPTNCKTSPNNSPKSIKNKRRWSTYINNDRDDCDSRTSSPSPSPNRSVKSVPATPLKVRNPNAKNRVRRASTGERDNRECEEGKRRQGEEEKQDHEAEEVPRDKKRDACPGVPPVLHFFKPSYRYIQTTQDFQTSDPAYLSYEKGEFFEVLAQIDPFRIFCVRGKKEGIIHVEFVKSVTDKDDFASMQENVY